MEKIEKARWKLNCTLCKQKNIGACIQCADSKCPTAMHVTCAQRAQLFMAMTDECDDVQLRVYCRRHTPKDSLPNFSVCPELAATEHLLLQVMTGSPATASEKGGGGCSGGSGVSRGRVLNGKEDGKDKQKDTVDEELEGGRRFSRNQKDHFPTANADLQRVDFLNDFEFKDKEEGKKPKRELATSKKSRNAFLPATQDSFECWKLFLKSNNIFTRDLWRDESNNNARESNGWPKENIIHYFCRFIPSGVKAIFKYAASQAANSAEEAEEEEEEQNEKEDAEIDSGAGGDGIAGAPVKIYYTKGKHRYDETMQQIAKIFEEDPQDLLRLNREPLATLWESDARDRLLKNKAAPLLITITTPLYKNTRILIPDRGPHEPGEGAGTGGVVAVAAGGSGGIGGRSESEEEEKPKKKGKKEEPKKADKKKESGKKRKAKDSDDEDSEEEEEEKPKKGKKDKKEEAKKEKSDAEEEEEMKIHKKEAPKDMEDETLECRDCSADFVFTVGEQEFFKEKGFDNKPTRCGECKAAKKARFDEGGGGGGGDGGGVCYAFQKGECTRGDGCRFSHS